MKTIIFGDTTADLSVVGEMYNAKFADKSNVTTAIQDNCNYYTSIGDLSVNLAIKLAESAQHLVIQSKQHWSNHDLLKTTVYVCRFLNHVRPVQNLDFYLDLDFTYHDTVPDSSAPALYIFGGSTMFGTGLDDREKRLGALISNKRNLELIDHSKPGAGLRRSFEQLILCSPKANDVVVLDATDPLRLRLMGNNNQVVDTTLHNSSKEIIMATTENQLFYNQVSYLDAFVKHCKLLNVKLVFFALQSYGPKFLDCLLYYSKYPNWCLKTTDIAHNPLDLCQDKIHPGPITHAAMADSLDLHITQLYENCNIW